VVAGTAPFQPPEAFGRGRLPWTAHFRGRHIDESLTSLTPGYGRAGSTADQKT